MTCGRVSRTFRRGRGQLLKCFVVPPLDAVVFPFFTYYCDTINQQITANILQVTDLGQRRLIGRFGHLVKSHA